MSTVYDDKGPSQHKPIAAHLSAITCECGHCKALPPRLDNYDLIQALSPAQSDLLLTMFELGVEVGAQLQRQAHLEQATPNIEHQGKPHSQGDVKGSGLGTGKTCVI